LTIAVSMKVVGVLLITSLLIIPPAAARRLSRNPEQMAMMAAVLGVLAVIAGLGVAFWLDTPAGPTIVVLATAFFAGSYFVGSASTN
jgi:zinc transport system permease protein